MEIRCVDKRSSNVVYSVQLFCVSLRISKYSNESDGTDQSCDTVRTLTQQ